MRDTNMILDVERRVLRQILGEGKEACIKASSILTGSDFSLSEHQTIFDVMQTLVVERNAVNFLSVAKFMRENPNLLEYQLQKVSLDGDLKKAVEMVLLTLTEISKIDLSHSDDFEQDSLFIRENGLRQTQIKLHMQAVRELRDGGDVFEALESSQEGLLKIYSDLEGIKLSATVSDAVEAAIKQMERELSGEIVRLKTGFSDLDAIIGGLENGRLYVLGAEEKLGKSIFISQVALHIAQQRLPVGLLSLEMKAADLGKRYLAMTAGLEAVNSLDVAKLRSLQKQFDGLPIYIYDLSLNTKQLYGLVQWLALEKKIRLLIVDYLQLVEVSTKFSTKTEEVNAVVKMLKRLAMDLNIPVFLIASLTIKGMYQRADKKPRASDFRDSGQIPYDADCVLLMWQPDEENKNYRELFVERSRYSRLGAIGLHFDEGRLMFQQVAWKEHDVPTAAAYREEQYFS